MFTTLSNAAAQALPVAALALTTLRLVRAVAALIHARQAATRRAGTGAGG